MEVYPPGNEGLPEAVRRAGFARTAFGVRTSWEDRITRYREAAEFRSAEFGAHFEDVVLDDGGSER